MHKSPEHDLPQHGKSQPDPENKGKGLTPPDFRLDSSAQDAHSDALHAREAQAHGLVGASQGLHAAADGMGMKAHALRGA
jgi:hypothetical protein